MDELHKKEIVTCAEMKELEKSADSAGLSYYQMMENAGTEAVKLILSHHQLAGKIWIFCGKGNNGGDGFVAARKLCERGAEPIVVLIEGEPVTKDAESNYQLIENRVEIRSAYDDLDIGPSDTVIDAIYGTGFHGSLRSPADRIIEKINNSAAYIASLDLPSGLSGDMTGEDLAGPCIKADLTVAFHGKKPVHDSRRAEPFLGKVVVADIGISQILSQARCKK